MQSAEHGIFFSTEIGGRQARVHLAIVDIRVAGLVWGNRVGIREADDELWGYVLCVSKFGDPKTSGAGHEDA